MKDGELEIDVALWVKPVTLHHFTVTGLDPEFPQTCTGDQGDVNLRF